MPIEHCHSLELNLKSELSTVQYYTWKLASRDAQSVEVFLPNFFNHFEFTNSLLITQKECSKESIRSFFNNMDPK